MELNLVTDEDLVVNPGDACVVEGKTGLQLIIACPGCGKVSGSAGSHKYDPKTRSYHPSIVHDKALGGCGWHGWLKNGEFTEC